MRCSSIASCSRRAAEVEVNQHDAMLINPVLMILSLWYPQEYPSKLAELYAGSLHQYSRKPIHSLTHTTRSNPHFTRPRHRWRNRRSKRWKYDKSHGTWIPRNRINLHHVPRSVNVSSELGFSTIFRVEPVPRAGRSSIGYWGVWCTVVCEVQLIRWAEQCNSTQNSIVWPCWTIGEWFPKSSHDQLHPEYWVYAWDWCQTASKGLILGMSLLLGLPHESHEYLICPKKKVRISSRWLVYIIERFSYFDFESTEGPRGTQKMPIYVYGIFISH